MSDGQWEVVGKSKKDKNAQNVMNSQTKSQYLGLENESDKKAAKDKKKDSDPKKAKKLEKKTELPKPKPPKTIEAAFDTIDASELSSVITSNKLRFSNAPLVWLKEVATFLNSKIQVDVDEPTFTKQSPSYPLCLLPADINNILEKLLQDAGKVNTQLFFDVTLTALANDMSRGQSVNGYRLLLQMLAHEHPEFCVLSISKSASLRNSYQNRPPIGLSLLWALGQGGVHNFNIGLQVWQELFLPIIELRNYSKYIVLYLSKLLERHNGMGSTKLSQEQYLNFLDSYSSKKNGISKELSSDLNKQLVKVKDIYFSKCGNKLQVTFNQLMKKMPNQYIESNKLDAFQNVLADSLVDCIQRDDSCNETWRQLFQRCSKQSATLLCYINSNWKDISSRIRHKSFKITVMQYKDICGDALKGKKKDETVVKTSKTCQGTGKTEMV